jgi:NADPH:quinone reductase-like Zn-dependent oxidoreductase
MSGLFKPKSTLLHGCDIAGEVVETGKNITDFQVGDPVFGDLGEHGWGAFAEYTCARQTDLALKPTGMSFEEAACISHGGNLATEGLLDYGKIKSGQKVLINGGGGSTGTLAIQIAKSFDTEVTAVDRSEKLDTMLALGADHVIDFTKEDFTQNSKKYNLIFDTKTTHSVSDYQRVLTPDGTYVTVGGKTSKILQVTLSGLFSKQQRLHMVPYKANKDLDYLTELFEAGELKPIIDKTFPLEETAEAFRYFAEGRFIGKIVVTLTR